MLTLLWVGISIHLWLLVLLPVVIYALYINHQTIVEQSKLQLTMRTNGELVVSDRSSPDVIKHNNDQLERHSSSDEVIVEIAAFWYFPRVLMLKLKAENINKTVYLTLFKSVINSDQFSQLLVGLTQLNTSTNKS